MTQITSALLTQQRIFDLRISNNIISISLVHLQVEYIATQLTFTIYTDVLSSGIDVRLVDYEIASNVVKNFACELTNDAVKIATFYDRKMAARFISTFYNYVNPVEFLENIYK